MSPARLLATLLCLLPAVALGGSTYTPSPTAAGIGAQPVDATLTALSGATCAADTLLYCDGADSVAAGTITAAGRAILDDATAADQLVTLGAGALCTGADATDVPYTPATGVDWTDPDPVDAADALDTLAGRVVALEAGGAGIAGTAGGTDNRLIRADGAGDTIQGSALTCDDSGNLSGLASVAIGGTTAASMLYSDSGAATNRWRMDADAGQARILSFASGDLARWALRVDGAEGGANAGGDIALRRYDDAGAFVATAWSAVRSTGAMTIPNVNITGGAISGITDLAVADGGTGASNAADARTNLGLGTAAVTDTGALAGNVVVLGMGAMLPAVNASQLTGITSTQVSGLGTMAAESSGSYATVNASNVADAAAWRTALGVDASGTSPYAADTWDYTWTASATSLADDGWTLVGSGSEAADVIGGVTCRSFTPAGAVATYYYKGIVTPGTGSFELRVRAYMPASTTNTITHAWSFFPSATGLNRWISMAVTSAGPQFVATSAALTSAGKMGGLVGRWIDWTIRVQNGGTGLGMGEVWMGPFLTWSGNISDMFNSTGTEGRFSFGRLIGTSGTSVTSLASIKYRDGWNDAPPSWTFRSLAGAVGP